MNCLIDNSITYLLMKGKKARAIRDYLKERYRITMDMPTLRNRIRSIRNKDGGNKVMA